MARYTHQAQYTITGINNEFEKIEQAIIDTVSRKGDVPNTMVTDLDFNGQRIYNLPDPTSETEPLTKRAGDKVIADATTQADRARTEANRAASEATDAAGSATTATNAAQTAASNTADLVRSEFTSLKDTSQTAATNAGVYATEAKDSAIAADNSEQTLQGFIDDYASNALVFPFDMGQISDTMIANQFDLGSIA